MSFTDSVYRALGRRQPALELIEDIEGVADATPADSSEDVTNLTDAELPSTNAALLLQKMESRLIRHHLARPEVLSDDQLRRIRYILNFARLADFEPGAAGPGGRRGRGDVSVGAELAPWRSRVADALHGPLREERDTVTALRTARDTAAGIADLQNEQRQVLADRHGNAFSIAELDAEVGYKKLVTVLGGGGGAGFVYIGGIQALLEAGHVPDYLIGSSFGAVMGSVIGRALPVPIAEYADWAKTVSYRAILGPERLRRRHGLAGMFSLRFNQFADAMLSRTDGERMRMCDLAIPFDAVVAGVRKQPFAALPPKYRRPQLAALQLRSIPHLPIRIGPQVSARLWQVAAFIDSRVTKPIVVGGDELTREFNVVDAASFSSAIPGVLHHETDDPAMYPILDALLDEHDVSALVDGGAASNVPIELAWKRVRAGRLGTRNACYLAFDCFHPRWDPRHLWLVAITQAVQLQMVRNVAYADHLIRFDPTLSPVNLAPSGAAIDRARQWGHQSVSQAIPVTTALLQPIWWDAERPPAPGIEPVSQVKSVAASMTAVMNAIRLPSNRFAGWRNRRMT